MARLFMYVFAQFGKTDAMSFCLEVGGSKHALHYALCSQKPSCPSCHRFQSI